MVAEFFDSIERPLQKLLTQLVDFYSGIQVSMRIVTDLYEQKHDITEKNFPTGSPWTRCSNKSIVNNVIMNSASYIIISLNQIINRSSEWCVLRIVRIEILAGLLEPLPGRGWLPLPSHLKRRHGLMNIVYKSNSSICFHSCLLAHLYSEEVANELAEERLKTKRLTKRAKKEQRKRDMIRGQNYEKYFQRNDFNFTNIDIKNNGVTLADLDTFENNNPQVSITVYNDKSKPIRSTEKEKRIHLDLLLLEKQLKNRSIFHYVLIKNKSRFFGKHDKHKHLYCGACCNAFRTKKAMESHVCGVSEKRERLPTKSQTYKFQNYEYTVLCPYVIYYTFKKIQFSLFHRSEVIEQVVVGYSIALHGPEGILIFDTYFGENPVRHFLNQALQIAENVVKHLKNTNNSQKPTQANLEAHRRATNCEFCQEPFTEHRRKQYHHHHQYSTYLHTICTR